MLSQRNEMKKIKTKIFSRSASLLSVGVSASASAAKVAIKSAFKNEDEKEELYNEFLKNQFEKFVSEIGQLKGGVMKAGQLLSIYGEHFFPDEVKQTLRRLQSDTTPVSFDDIKKVIIKGLGKEKFNKIKFYENPIGAASLGQVYQVEIDSQMYALKVQYPGVAKSIDSDLNMAKRLLSVFKIGFDSKKFDEIFEEVRSMLHREADYKKELLSLEKHYRLVHDDKSIVIPKPISEYSSKRVLCMSYEPGVRLDDPKVLKLPQDRRNALGHLLLKVLFLELFHWKSVQTDSHIGNYLVQLKEDGFETDRIVLLDFGALRKLPNMYIHPLKKMAVSSLEGNKDGVVQGAIDLTYLHENDSQARKDLFTAIVNKGLEPFAQRFSSKPETDKGYDWSSSQIVQDFVNLAKQAVLTTKPMQPPKEAVFVDRKLVGTFTLLKTLEVKYGPHDLAKEMLGL